ncbi:acyloxyacyl hydrolase [Flavobacterium chuncheonense]|uniref:Acyloxyacyl hydrolase n=1 Tax=Flavobacterium chuncheonense TaxID=2026653 RepID=A0ABW5YKI7_9FLAO
MRIGVLYGFASQNTILKQDSDYTYKSDIFKFSSHFNIYSKNRHALELLVEPSYYKSKHESLNYWHAFYTSSETPDLYREQYMKLKDVEEYVLNLGVIYRFCLLSDLSVYALGNVGPMYIDTDTEMLKKGFAFSDIFALGTNYKMNKISFDVKCMIRHVSNANLQKPNYGLNSVGFEFGVYYEFNSYKKNR